MMALDSAIVILMAEALGVITILAVAWFFVARNRRGKELDAIHQFIDQQDEQALVKNQPLDELLSNGCGLDRELVNAILQEVTDCERNLYQRIIQLFLQRDMTLLNEIDQGIGNLSEPYCRVISKMAATGSDKTASGAGAAAGGDHQAAGLERINQQLMRQLDTAMKTIDEITAEYTRVFSGNQTALELENSSKKMLQIFHEAEQAIKTPPGES